MHLSITVIIIVATVIPSLLAFNNPNLVNQFVFWPYRVWRNNEWHRLFTSGFIHADFMHLFFNMFALYGFGEFVESAFTYHFPVMGRTLYVLMYFIAISTADLYNLFHQKDNYSYRALGASGGVSAVIFAAILFAPKTGISIYFLPAMPAFIFGPLYLAYCIFMAKRGQDNIGHLAHFTGAVFGFLFPLIIQPSLFSLFLAQLIH